MMPETYCPQIIAEIEDIGHTCQIVFKIGQEEIIRYLPGTKYVDSAKRSVHEILAAALRPSFVAAVRAEPHASGLRTLETRTNVREAAQWLRDFLADHGGEASAHDVRVAGAREGFIWRTLQRSRGLAGVTSTRVKGLGAGTIWQLNPRFR